MVFDHLAAVFTRPYFIDNQLIMLHFTADGAKGAWGQKRRKSTVEERGEARTAGLPKNKK